MALNANCVANVTTSGNDSNAGWFDTTSGDTAGGVNDRAFSNSPIIIDGVTITASVHSTTTQANIVGHTLATTDRGNVLRISGGTATAGYYRITSVDTANNRVTVDASMGTASATITGRIGGAFASPGQAGATKVAASSVWIKSGTYTITSGSANVSSGLISDTTGGTHPRGSKWEGYETTYKDGGTRPVLQVASSGVTSVTVFSVSSDMITVDNIEIDGQSKTSIRGFSFTGTSNRAHRCIARNCTNSGFQFNSTFGHYVSCAAISCSTQSAFLCENNPGLIANSICSNCSAGGFLFSGPYVVVNCIASGTTGVGFNTNGNRPAFHGCISYNSSSHGFQLTGNYSRNGNLIDCVSYLNGGSGFHTDQTPGLIYLIRCSGGSNSSGNYTASQIALALQFETLTADPFVDAANGNFALNSTSGGGATLRALNFQLPSISTTRYPFGGWYAPGGGCPLIGPGGLVY
jgi:hypothetical protein